MFASTMLGEVHRKTCWEILQTMIRKMRCFWRMSQTLLGRMYETISGACLKPFLGALSNHHWTTISIHCQRKCGELFSESKNTNIYLTIVANHSDKIVSNHCWTNVLSNRCEIVQNPLRKGVSNLIQQTFHTVSRRMPLLVPCF